MVMQHKETTMNLEPYPETWSKTKKAMAKAMLLKRNMSVTYESIGLQYNIDANGNIEIYEAGTDILAEDELGFVHILKQEWDAVKRFLKQ